MSVTDQEKAAKARDAALQGRRSRQIEREFGKGTVMRMGRRGALRCAATRSPPERLSLDLALGIGGVPRGRIVEIYGPEVLGQDHADLSPARRGPEAGRACAPSSTAEPRDGPAVCKSRSGVDIDELLVSQPDYGEAGPGDRRHARAFRPPWTSSRSTPSPRSRRAWSSRGQMGDQTVGGPGPDDVPRRCASSRAT